VVQRRRHRGGREVLDHEGQVGLVRGEFSRQLEQPQPLQNLPHELFAQLAQEPSGHLEVLAANLAVAGLIQLEPQSQFHGRQGPELGPALDQDGDREPQLDRTAGLDLRGQLLDRHRLQLLGLRRHRNARKQRRDQTLHSTHHLQVHA